MSSLVKIVCIAGVALARAGATSPSAELSVVASRFEEPLLATGPVPAGENLALLAAIKAYEAPEAADDFATLHSFLADYPRSGWRIALLTNLGLSYYHYGYFS